MPKLSHFPQTAQTAVSEYYQQKNNKNRKTTTTQHKYILQTPKYNSKNKRLKLSHPHRHTHTHKNITHLSHILREPR